MITIRLWFTKTGEAAYISLLDLQRVMQRALKRSGLPVWYTQGFNPHIYMTFAAPLALGQESLVESMDFKSEKENWDWSMAKNLLQKCLPSGIDVVKLELAGRSANEIAYGIYSFQVHSEHAKIVKEAFEAYNQAERALVIKQGKKGKQKEIDLKVYLPNIEYTHRKEGLFARVVLPTGNSFTLNPSLLLHYFQQTNAIDP
uniref:TIGR03936 family radical SAM-associated protein n=1 Tax=uncultured Ruthenibacterium sp. TaxID=1905347 RepID=UPI00349E4D59